MSDFDHVQIHFSETMSGFISPDATLFEDGYHAGEKAGRKLALLVAVDIENLQHFLDSPERAGTLTGYLDSAFLGGRCPVSRGVFKLMPTTADLDRRIMYYQVYCTTPDGKAITLIGEKQVQNDFGPDLWHDTTTLFTNVYSDHIDPTKRAQAKLLATGIIGLDLLDFWKVLGTLKATGPDGKKSLAGLAAFGKFFVGSLWDVYGPSLPPSSNHPTRRYPRYTPQGVHNAKVSVHPFSTGDGFGLQLTRFLREPCDDVVLLIHGLTNSSDMFIMPEHTNLTQCLLDNGFTDVWALDYRASCRFVYNLNRNRDTFDDIALFDHPAALATLRQIVGPNRRIHVIAHCVGSITFCMSLFGKTISGIRSAVLNSVSITPTVSPWAKAKLAIAPFMCDYVLGIEYVNPSWRRQPGWSMGKLMAIGANLVHHECDSPECHMLSFMWGSGRPAIYNHQNMAPETHDRLSDLFGGTAVHYYRHVRKMVQAQAIVKYDPENPRHASLPDDYLAHAADVKTPLLFVQGQDNRVFRDANINAHARMEKIVPGRHQLHVFPGYGHQDVIMGKNVAQDTFPRMLEFLNAQRHD